MARTTISIYKCDRCGTDIERDSGFKLTLALAASVNNKAPAYDKFDLCIPCHNWVKNQLNELTFKKV